MLKLSIPILAFLAASTAVTVAACPLVVPSNASEAIQANRERIRCLQAEIEGKADQRRLEFELRRQQSAIQKLQLQRRLDQLTFETRRF